MEENNNFEASRSKPVSIENWLEQMAASTGVEREEVLEQMVSAYWTLEEIIGLLRTADESGENVTPERVPDAHETRMANVSHERPSTEQFDQLRAELDFVNEHLEELDLAVLDEKSDESLLEKVDSIDDKISAVSRALSARQAANRDYVETEFENLRVILEYLFEATDDHTRHTRRTDESIDALVTRADLMDASMAEFEYHLRNHETLTYLKQEASRLNVSKADCENCETTLRITLLATPCCPHCERDFTGLERSRGFLSFGSNTLTVLSEQEGELRQTLTWNEQTVPGRSRTEFRWLGDEQLEDYE